MRMKNLLLLLAVTACSPPDDATTQSDTKADRQDNAPMLADGIWRAGVSIQGQELPFQLEVLPMVNGRQQAFLLNGDEREPVQEIVIDGSHVELRMTSFNTWIEGELNDGVIEGHLHKVKLDTTEVMPVRLVHGQQYRFAETFRRPEVDVSGRYAVTFTEPDGHTYPAVGIFEQQGNTVTGTFLSTTSDYRYLAGSIEGRRLQLSAYDGYHVYLFAADVEADGSLRGDYWAGASWHEDWIATPDAQAQLPDVDALSYLKPGYERFEFEFPDTDGRRISSNDARFRNKVLIVQLAGSWCPNCADETRFLAPWYRDNRARGVEVVALMFENLTDFDAAARQVDIWRQQWQVEYPTLIAGVSDKTMASEALPQLNAVLAFPTTIFIGKDGKVARVHNGFSGPATGQHYLDEIASFNATVDALLNAPETQEK